MQEALLLTHLSLAEGLGRAHLIDAPPFANLRSWSLPIESLAGPNLVALSLFLRKKCAADAAHLRERDALLLFTGPGATIQLEIAPFQIETFLRSAANGHEDDLKAPA